jgi:hypothetical protein
MASGCTTTSACKRQWSRRRYEYTDKKEKKIFLIYREIQSGGVGESKMRKGCVIFEEMRKHFPIYEKAISHTYIYDFATAPL